MSKNLDKKECPKRPTKGELYVFKKIRVTRI